MWCWGLNPGLLCVPTSSLAPTSSFLDLATCFDLQIFAPFSIYIENNAWGLLAGHPLLAHVWDSPVLSMKNTARNSFMHFIFATPFVLPPLWCSKLFQAMRTFSTSSMAGLLSLAVTSDLAVSSLNLTSHPYQVIYILSFSLISFLFAQYFFFCLLEQNIEEEQFSIFPLIPNSVTNISSRY